MFLMNMSEITFMFGLHVQAKPHSVQLNMRTVLQCYMACLQAAFKDEGLSLVS